jgi:hypothetical protein
MKTGLLFFCSFLLSLAVLAAQNSYAGSAVAWDGHGHLVTFHGYPEAQAKRLALERGQERYGASVRILAATDVPGYGAIALARRGNTSIIGVALGRSTAKEAEQLAIEQCLNSGGTEPKVKWRFRG